MNKIDKLIMCILYLNFNFATQKSLRLGFARLDFNPELCEYLNLCEKPRIQDFLN